MATKPKIDTVAALEAKLKEAKGQPLSKIEERLVRQYDEEKAIEIRDGILLNLPKGIYEKLSGRSQKVLLEQAKRYGLPFDGAKVDLFQVIRKFHEMLIEWGPVIRELEGEGGELKKEKNRLDIAILTKKDQLLELELREKHSEYINRELLRVRLEWLATKLRNAGERLGQRFGADAQHMLNNALKQIDEELN